MRVLVVSQYYRPEEAPIVVGVAEGLVGRGHQVRALTGFPNYPAGVLFEGYRQRWRWRELISGVDVLRVPLFVDHSQSGLRRALNYLTFGVSAATAYSHGRGAEVVYVYATQMTAAFGPWLWRFAGGPPYVLHVQDLWPDSVTGSSLVRPGVVSRIVHGLLTPWLRSVYRRSHGVIAIAPQMLETLAARGVRRDALHLVHNWADVAQPLVDVDGGMGLGGRVVMYAGNVGDMQDLDTVVRAAARLGDDGLTLRIVGDGVALPRIRALSESLGVKNIEFRDRVPMNEMAALYATADYSLVTLKDLPVFEGTIPSKLQASLAYGAPVITTIRGDVRKLVREHRVGFTADPESVSSLEEAFRRALGLSASDRSEMAERALLLYARQFSKKSGLDHIERVLSQPALGKGN